MSSTPNSPISCELRTGPRVAYVQTNPLLPEKNTKNTKFGRPFEAKTTDKNGWIIGNQPLQMEVSMMLNGIIQSKNPGENSDISKISASNVAELPFSVSSMLAAYLRRRDPSGNHWERPQSPGGNGDWSPPWGNITWLINGELSSDNPVINGGEWWLIIWLVMVNDDYIDTGWWFQPTPLKNDGVSSSVGMMTYPQYDGKVIKFHGSKAPTSKRLKTRGVSHSENMTDSYGG